MFPNRTRFAAPATRASSVSSSSSSSIVAASRQYSTETIEQPDFTEDEHYETQTANRVVYVTFVEVSPRAGCRVLNAEEYSGALMMCFLPATSPDDALARLHNRLDKEKLDIVTLSFRSEGGVLPAVIFFPASKKEPATEGCRQAPGCRQKNARLRQAVVHRWQQRYCRQHHV